MITEKMEEYLEALFKLSCEDGPLTPTRLAEHLGVTPPTVLDMLRRLEAEGYIRYADAAGGQAKGRGKGGERGPGKDASRGPDKGRGRARREIALTAKGQRAARTLVRRHRLSERFLTDVLGLDWESAHREACKLEHVLSPEVEEKLAEVLGKTRQPFNANAVAQAGALAGLLDEDHQRRTRELTREGIGFLQTAFGRLGLTFVPTHANFILVRVGDGDAVFRALLRQGIIVRAMAAYGLPEWIRVSIGTPEQNARFLQALTPLVTAEPVAAR